jgi:hydrogenase-4 component E
MIHTLSFDVAHTLAGLLLLCSFMLLYQVRIYALLHALALQSVVLTLAVAWQAQIQGAPHLFITAAITLGFKAILIPLVLRRMVTRMGLHREIELVGGIGMTMLAGMALVALSLKVMLPVTSGSDPVAREDIALALSVVLMGLPSDFENAPPGNVTTQPCP